MTSSFFSKKAKDTSEVDTRRAAAVGVRSEGHVPTVSVVDAEEDIRFSGTSHDRSAKHIPFTSIIAKKQVRTEFDEDSLKELAESIKNHKQQSPSLVYWSESDNKYVIVAGERRFRAAQMVEGLQTLLCRVHPHEPSPEELLELSFVENAQRKNLSPIEEALAYKKFQTEFGYSTTKIAERTGKNQSTISRALSLLKLPEDIQGLIGVGDGKIPTSVAREMAKLKDESQQRKMADDYLSGNLTTAKAQEQTSKKKPSASKSAKSNKRWTVDGIPINVPVPKGKTMADVGAALIKKGQEILNDGRTRKAA